MASSWRNAYYPEVVTRLREAGHEVYGKTLIRTSTNGVWKNTRKAYSTLHQNYNSKQILMLLIGQTHAYWCSLAVAAHIQKPELMYKLFDLISSDIDGVCDYLATE